MTRTHIIFDNDGVNIDSEDVAMRVMDDWGIAFVRGLKPDADLPRDYIYANYAGTSSDKIVEALIRKYDLSHDHIAAKHNLDAGTLEEIATALADDVTLQTNLRFQQELKSIPGATAALEEIHRMFGSGNVALMTTSRADRMDISLAHAADPHTGENARLEHMFPKGERRRSGYGHPNKYDEGFSALGWNPATAIVVEDSLSGVSKAKAGRPELAVIGTVAAKFYTDKEAQALKLLEYGADIVISDFSDLPKAAQWLKDGKPEALPAFKGQVFFPEPGPSKPGPDVKQVSTHGL